MTAILLNDGEIAAPGPGKCFLVLRAGEIAIKTTDGAGKIIFGGIQGPDFAHRAAREIHIIRG